MKKIIAVVLMLTLITLGLFSCKKKDKDKGDGGNTQIGDVGVIYDENTPLNIVMTLDEDKEKNRTMQSLCNALAMKLPTYPDIIAPTAQKSGNELVIGKCDRPVSVEAYRLLEAMRYDEENEGWPRLLVYTDGSSVAIAYDECEEDVAFYRGIDYFLENLVVDTLRADAGTLYKELINLDTYFQERDDLLVAEKWTALQNAIGGDLGSDVVGAFKKLYGLYSDDLISWLANLYDPAIGGFYYSNSGRNTDGYLPDAESTAQALRFIDDSGMIDTFAKGYEEALPEEMSRAIIDFIYNLQDPNGYFYHPQWSKEAVDNKVSRRSRDLGHCTGILSSYGLTPKYTTPNGVEGEDIEPVAYKGLTTPLGGSAVVAASKVLAVAEAETAVDPKLKNKDTFIAWLDSLNIQTKSYSAGNTLTAFFSEIKQRDVTLSEENAGYSLVEILIDYINDKQFDNGLWHAETNYYGVNGLMKMSGVYSKANAPFPNSDKALQAAIDAITSEEVPTSVTDTYNTWYAVNRMMNIITKTEGDAGAAYVAEQRQKLLERAPYAIEVTMKKLAVHKKPDGSFSYGVMYSPENSQGMPVALPESYEGDVNGTIICTSDILNYIYSSLGLSKYRVPIYTYNDWRTFLSIVDNLQPVIKDEEDSIYEPVTFDDDPLGDVIADEVSVNDRSSSLGGGISVIEDPRDTSKKVLKVTSVATKSDAVVVSSPNLSHAFSCFAFEGDFCLLSSNTDFPIRITMGESYIVSIKIKDGKVIFVESSSETSSKSKDVILPMTAEIGEWFRLKIEYYKGDHNTVRIKVYFDKDLTDKTGEKLVAVSDNYLDQNGNKFINGTGEPALQFSSTQFWFMKSYDIEFMMDNVCSYKLDQKYKKYTDKENPLDMNVDASASDGEDDESSKPAFSGPYYNSTEIPGTRYDFSEKLSKDYIYNKSYNADTEEETVSVPISTDVYGGKLNVANLSNWSGFAIANHSATAGGVGYKYVFETDFVWLGGSQSAGAGVAAYVGFLGEHKSVDNNYMSSCFTTSFSETDSNVLIFGGAELQRNKAYNIRVEYLVGGKTYLYVDGELAASFVGTAGVNADQETFVSFGMYMRKNFVDPFSFTMDNTYLGIEYLGRDPYAPPADAGLPEDLETMYGDSTNSGTRHDFENSGSYGSNVIYDKSAGDTENGTSPIARVEGGMLKIDSAGTKWEGFAIANGGDTSGGEGYTYVFEANFRWTSGSQAAAQLASGAAFLGFLGEHASVDNNYMSKHVYLSFKDCDENQMKLGGVTLKRGTTYNIRFEYTVGGDVKLYVNGTLADAVSATTGASSDSSSYKAFGMYIRRDISPDLEFTLDNVYMGTVAPAAGIDPGVPGDLNTYYNGGLTDADETAKYDFTTASSYGRAVFYDKKAGVTSDPKFASVSEGMLRFSHLDSANGDATRYQGFAVSSGTESSYTLGTTYVFETDFKWIGGTQATAQISKYAAYIGLLGEHQGVDNAYMPYAISVSLIDGDNTAILFGNTKLMKGTTYNIRIEVTTGEGLKLYVNGVESETGKVFVGANADDTTFAGFGWYSRRSFETAFEFTMDNAFMGVKLTEEEKNAKTATVLPTATGANGTVVLMHDDGTLATVAILDQVFKEYGLVGNVALLGNKVYTVTDGVGAYNTSNISNWQSYLNTGRWQISSHSMTHEFWGLTDKAETVYGTDGVTVLATIAEDGMITYEVIDSQKILQTAFPSQRVLTFAYPGFWAQRSLGMDRFSAVARALVDSVYIAGRDSYGNANMKLDDTSIDWKFAPSYQLDASNVNDIVAAVNNAAKGEMAVIFTHKVVSDDTETLGSNTMYEKDFRTVAAKVAALQASGKVWCAFYEDAVLYTREAQATTVTFTESDSEIKVTLTNSLDKNIYNYPLTVRVLTPDSWEAVKITQGDNVSYAYAKIVNGRYCIDASIAPDGTEASVTPIDPSELEFYTYFDDESITTGNRYDFEDGKLPDAVSANNDKITSPETLTVAKDSDGNNVLNETSTAWYGFAIESGDDTAYSAGKYVFEADIVMNKLVYKDTSGSEFVGFITYADQYNKDGAVVANNTTTNAAAFADTYMTVNSECTTYTWFGYTLEVGKKYNVRAVYDVETDICSVYVNGQLVSSGEFGSSNAVKSRDDSVFRGFIFYPRAKGVEFTLDNVFIGVVDGVEKSAE